MNIEYPENQEFVYYPIIVPTLNRYVQFKRLIESLQKNTDADKTELVIGLDYPPSDKYREGYEMIRDYIPSISGFKKVTFFRTDVNLGPYYNDLRLRQYVKSEGYDAYIGTEDDNEFSPNFIQYMNWGLNEFRNDNRIYAICGFNKLNTDGVVGNVFILNHIFAGWGAGQWFNRQEKLAPYVNLHYQKEILDAMPLSIVFNHKVFKASAILGMLYGGWPYGDTIPMFLPDNERWCVFPTISKVRNWGQDGSGLHGGSEDGFRMNSTMPIDTSCVFNGDDREDFYSPIMEKRFRAKYKKTARNYFRRVLNFLVYKMTGKMLVGNHTSKWLRIKLENLKLPKVQ